MYANVMSPLDEHVIIQKKNGRKCFKKAKHAYENVRIADDKAVYLW